MYNEVTMTSVIEIYFDPSAIKHGKIGCMRARLKDNHGWHAAGLTIDDALKDLMCTLSSTDLSSNLKDYTCEKIQYPRKVYGRTIL